MPLDRAVGLLAGDGWPIFRDWTLADLLRIRREFDVYVGPHRAVAIARLDALISDRLR